MAPTSLPHPTTTPGVEAGHVVWSEPEAEPTTEITAVPETEPEITAGPETEPEITSELETEPEITAEPESEPQVTAEPATEPEITAEPETEPEITAEPETEPEITAEPESEPQVTAEPETEPEITAEPETEPEITAEPETEPEITAEPETEPEITAEPETEPEITAEPETEPEITAEPETEPEITAEPETEPEITAGPETEPEVEPETEPEITSEPEGEGAAGAESGILLLPQYEPSAEFYPSPEPTAEVESEYTVTAEGAAFAEPPASIEAITTPTILLILLIASGMGWLIIQRRFYAKREKNRTIASLVSRIVPIMKPRSPDDAFLSPFDEEVLDNKEKFYNRTGELLWMCAPAVVSILQAPLVLYLYPTLVSVMWPSFETAPNVNDAIACFLMPAGLVYATVFGAAFSAASGKLSELQAKFIHEISMLDQIFTLTMKLDITSEQKMAICKAVKTETIYMMLQIEGRTPDSFENIPPTDVKVHIWEIIDILKTVGPKGTNPSTDFITQNMITQILNHMVELNSVTSDNNAVLTSRIHPVKWAFLETLGFFSFFGVALIDTKSTVLSLGICMITVFSISILCFVIADLDNPFSGFFRLDLSLLNVVMTRGKRMYTQLSEGREGLPRYDRFSIIDVRGRKGGGRRNQRPIMAFTVSSSN